MPSRPLILSHDDEKFSRWNAAIDDASIRSSLKRVEIDTVPDLRELEHSEHSHKAWCKWAIKYTYPAFTDALYRIKELGALSDITLRFSDVCAGVENDLRRIYQVYETVALRLRILETVFGAIRDRADQDSIVSPIRSLTIENLQNIPLHGFTGSNLFKSVTKHVEELHLLVAVEYNEHGPDPDLSRVERTQFEPYLCAEWLAPFAHRLTDLSLSFNEPWGTAPGYFDGVSLVFPHLKTLNLGKFWSLSMGISTGLRGRFR